LAKSIGDCSDRGGADARVALRCRRRQELQQRRRPELFFVFFAQFEFQQQPQFEQQFESQFERKQLKQEFQFGQRKEL